MKVAEAAPSRAELFLEGLLGSIALGVLSNGQIDVTLGVLMAGLVVLGWIAGPVSSVASIGLGVVGIAASLPGIAEYLVGDNCMFEFGVGWRVTLVIVMAVLFAWGGLHTIFRTGSLKAAGQVGLGWFSMVELLTFASTSAALTRYSIGIAIVGLGVVVLGALVGFMPQIGIWAVGLGTALITLTGSTYVGITSEDAIGCQPLSDATGSAFSYLVAFIPVGIVVFILRKLFRRS